MQHILPWMEQGRPGGTCMQKGDSDAMQVAGPGGGERGEEASDGAESPPGHLLLAGRLLAIDKKGTSLQSALHCTDPPGPNRILIEHVLPSLFSIFREAKPLAKRVLDTDQDV
jgi:hypothetical protein